MVVAATWGTGQVFLEMLYFFLFFLWIWLAIIVFSDIFRSRDLSGWGKAAWSIFVIVLPFLGIFVYLVARGKKMGEHAAEAAQAQDQAMRSYIKDVVSSDTTDDQLTTLSKLRDQGVIDNEEYQRMKARVGPA
jgi:hypothetical protein